LEEKRHTDIEIQELNGDLNYLENEIKNLKIKYEEDTAKKEKENEELKSNLANVMEQANEKNDEITDIRAENSELDKRILQLQQQREIDRERIHNLEKQSGKETLLRNSAFKKCQDEQSFLRIERNKLTVCQVTLHLKLERECRFEKQKCG
jgi:chromosome segregation ATPase